MPTTDIACSISPYFEVFEGRLDAFRDLCERFVARTRSEEGCLYYGFCFDGNQIHCREAYRDARSLLAHLQNVADLLAESQRLAKLTRLEIAGPESELQHLRGPLAAYKPQFLVLEYGFRN